MNINNCYWNLEKSIKYRCSKTHTNVAANEIVVKEEIKITESWDILTDIDEEDNVNNQYDYEIGSFVALDPVCE